DFGAPSGAEARLLAADANTRVRFVPVANFEGTVAGGLTFHAWDQTTGAAGDTADVTTSGGTTAFSSATASASITVNAINDAPGLLGSNDMDAINEDDFDNAGTLVSNLIAGQVDEVDSGATCGIAVVSVDDTDGTWQYSTDGGQNWTGFGSVSENSARLLAADGDTRVRFVPSPDWNGSVANGLTFRAWDQTTGSAGGTANVTTNGGSTAFSSGTASAGITNVDAVNDAPVLSGTNNLPSINENIAGNGTLVSSLLTGHVTDVGSGALGGIAVTGVDNTHGTWQYSTNGGTSWTSFGNPSNTSARLLAADANTRVRFVPAANWNGTVPSGLTFRAWDQTMGSPTGVANTTTNGGTTAFSTDTASASITVNPVNNAPDLAGANDLTSINEDDTTNSGTLVADLISGQTTDDDDSPLTGIAVFAVDNTNGSWQYSTDGGSNWSNFGSASSTSA